MYGACFRKREIRRWQALIREHPAINTDDWESLNTELPPSPPEIASASSAPANVSAIAACKRVASSAPVVVCEYACDCDSSIGKAALERGLESERFNLERSNLLTYEGQMLAINTVDNYLAAGYIVILHSAVPCTPWCSWQYLNLKKHPSLEENILLDRSESYSLIRAFVNMSKRVLAAGGYVSFEWPRNAIGHRDPTVIALPNKIEWLVAEVHGCMLGLTGKEGKAIFFKN